MISEFRFELRKEKTVRKVLMDLVLLKNQVVIQVGTGRHPSYRVGLGSVKMLDKDRSEKKKKKREMSVMFHCIHIRCLGPERFI